MLRKIPILILALICLLSTLLSAQENHYSKARQGLREAYEHVTGVSLKDAIDQLIAEKRGDKFANGNVIVRFNGGGVRNKLFIGRKNTLEILVENDYDLQAVTMAFEFTCTSGPNTFSWVEGYGPIPGGGESVVIMHDDGFPYGDSWTSQYWAPNRPDSIQLGGVAWTSSQYLGVNSSPTLLFSMQIELPDDPSMVGDTFYVDNIVHPPAGNWFFQEAPPGSSLGYAPDFQYNPNQSKFNPDAPPVGFEIAAPMCEFAGKASNPNIAYISEDSLIRPSQLSRVAFDPEAGAEQEIGVRVGFVGNIDDIKKYVSKGRIDRISSRVIAISIKLESLPELCQEKSVQYIRSLSKVSPQLNYSTDDINCVYSVIQDSLHVSGDSVIVGVIDCGIDWLHQDFIDSNGHTRILAFWDQTDTTGSHPSNPYFDFGTELSYATINSYVHSSPPPPASDSGRDYRGHGTFVSGVAVGNNRSGGSESFVGVAPKANIIFVKIDPTNQTLLDEAVEYIAAKAALFDKPWVINMSIGLDWIIPHAHRGNYFIETFIDGIVTSSDPAFGEGKAVVVAAGNYGEDKIHASCNGPGTIDLLVNTNATTAIDEKVWIYILYEKSGVSDDAWVKVIGPNNTYDPVPLNCASNNAYELGYIADTINTDGVIRICHDYFDVRYIEDPIDGDHPEDYCILIQLEDGYFASRARQLSAGNWQIEMGGTGLGEWDAYIYERDTINQLKYFTGSKENRENTIMIPGYAHEVITVGSVNSSRTQWTNPYNSQRNVSAFPGSYPVDSISSFSSMGPARDGRVKPDLYAPGAFIISSRSNNITDSSKWGHPINDTLHDLNGMHYISLGTSYSAPHVAGLIALMLDKNPMVTRSEMLSCLRSTSSNGTDGIVNGYEAIDCLSYPYPCQGICGDANGDCSHDISDAVYVINFAFGGGGAPLPFISCGDANGDASSDISDAVYLINFAFGGGPPPGDCAAGDPYWGGDDCCPY